MLDIQNAYVIDCHELTQFVKDYYNREISVVQRHAEYLGNDSFLEIDVDKEDPEEWYPDEEDLADNPEDAIEKWLSGEEDFQFLENELGINEHVILWDLCRKGIIPEGKYILKIWW